MAIRNVGFNTGGARPSITESLTTVVATGATEAVRLTERFVVQVSGTATSFVGMLQRSTSDPADAANWANALEFPLVGDLVTGLSAQTYEEPGAAWYRMNVTTLTGGNATISIMGKQAV